MMKKQEYSQLVKEKSPNSPVFMNCIKAFLIGGLICLLGQGLTNLYTYLGVAEKDAKTLTSVTLVFLGVLLTTLDIYGKIAKHAGAGTLLPITGFANSVAAPAIEFKSEGYILGVGAKIFSIAGPVIVYGTLASVIYGVVYWITTLF
ncbi:MAG: stage V sporulation protein AC [Ruminococcaceae bacterium]|nr:stage V sporulation protein AC [Oscillospiraceae bacterium]